MNKANVVVCLFMLLAVTDVFALEPPKLPLGFFVTSSGLGKGANLGGLAGADAHCQQLAKEAGWGGRSWHAYLSIQAEGNKPAINARDRIGKGPWANAKGVVIAEDLAHLHGDKVALVQLENNVNRLTTLNEKGELIKGSGDTINQHDIITGTLYDGKAYNDGSDHTCQSYTSSAEGRVQMGHSDHSNHGVIGGNLSWNSTHASRGCSPESLKITNGAGYFYCFAAN
jgi:hypothetical protein